jgi:5-methylcytosine-specific restriction endonuclease McrA
MAKRKPRNIFSFLIPRLRKISLQWPARYEAKSKAKVKVEDGFFKNGNPKYLTKYKCAKCQNLFLDGEVDVDHIIPVSNLNTYGTWDKYIPALLCDVSALQVLCKSCHHEKSAAEQTERADRRRAKKLIKE